MAHELDTTAGRTSFVSRDDAWHQLGTTLGRAFTAEEAMREGLLGNWNVRKAPLTAHDENGREVPVEDRFAVLRDNPVEKGRVDVLGTVGDAYHIIQNEQHAGLLNALIDESGAHFESAGALHGGRRVFITMKLPGHMNIGGVDRVQPYIAALNSHDGSSAFTFLITPIRIVCQNTLNLALSEQTNSFRVRHTTGAGKAIIQQAREALDLTFDYLDTFQEEAEQLINTTLTQDRFEELITREYGPSEDSYPATVTRRENQLDQMFQLYSDSYTHAGVRDTAWAAVNTLVEWYDHLSPVRGDNQELTRATNALLLPRFKQKAMELVKQEVGL